MYNTKYIQAGLCALFCMFQVIANAQAVKIDTSSTIIQNITQNTQIYEERGNEMSIEEVRRKTFRRATEDEKQSLFIPFSDDTYWLKWEFENATSTKADYVIQFRNGLLEFVELYEFNDSLQQFIKTGAVNSLTTKQSAFASNDPILNFTVRKSGKTEVYAKIRSQRGILMRIAAFPAYYKNEVLSDDHGQLAFINGALTFRLVLILILGFFIIRVAPFRAYSFLILVKTLGYWGLFNYFGPYFSDNPVTAQTLNFIAYTANSYGIVLLAYVLLPMDKLPKWLKYVFILIVFAVALNHAFVMYDYNWAYLKWGIVQLMLFTGFTLALFVYAYSKRLKLSYFYVIPFLVGIASYLLFNMRLMLHRDLPFVSFIIFFLFIAEILVFILFLGKIFRDNEAVKLAVSRDLLIKEQQAVQLKELDELKSRFFTNVSHELKTPLTLIAGPIQELMKRYPGDNLLKLVRPNLKRLQDLVNQILDIQRLEAGKQTFSFELIDLPQHLRLHVFSFDSMAESKNIRLELKQSHEDFVACVDIDKFNKIISNLISNAIKYSNENTHVKIKAVYRDSPKRFQLSIQDEGFGIAKADLPYIYDRFYQIENENQEGSGIGLALVKELVNAWKGTIDVRSKLNVGTEFLVSLPVDEQLWKPYLLSKAEVSAITETIELEENEEVAKSSTAEEKELILIVEDNPEMQKYLRVLMEETYDVMVASNGKEGIEKANEEIPDLIISDLMMPKMDGFEFSRTIKNQLTTSHVPIVMLTAKDTKESKLEGFEIGVDHFLAKPFDADELKLIVRKSIDNRKHLKVLFGKEPAGTAEVSLVPDSLEEQFRKKINDILEERYTDTGLSVIVIAEAMDMSDKQLRRKLKAVEEISPVEYLRKFRLRKAAVLLTNPALSVSDIAFQVGFDNLSYFSKVFQKEYNCLPSEYASQNV